MSHVRSHKRIHPTTHNDVNVYRLTAQGRRQLALERREWARVVGAMAQVLES
jgi:DNA-binding PadR family transcriptional regulator